MEKPRTRERNVTNLGSVFVNVLMDFIFISLGNQTHFGIQQKGSRCMSQGVGFGFQNDVGMAPGIVDLSPVIVRARGSFGMVTYEPRLRRWHREKHSSSSHSPPVRIYIE